MTTALTVVVARLLLLFSFVVAAAVLVKGYADVGDGFSAGVIAALGVLLQYIACGYDDVEATLPTRFAPVTALAGLLLALLVTFFPVLRREPLLSHRPAPGTEVVHLGSLELHTAVLFDLGVFLLVQGFIVTIVRVLGRIGKEME